MCMDKVNIIHKSPLKEKRIGYKVVSKLPGGKFAPEYTFENKAGDVRMKDGYYITCGRREDAEIPRHRVSYGAIGVTNHDNSNYEICNRSDEFYPSGFHIYTENPKEYITVMVEYTNIIAEGKYQGGGVAVARTFTIIEIVKLDDDDEE